jgi:hypothetical protein
MFPATQHIMNVVLLKWEINIRLFGSGLNYVETSQYICALTYNHLNTQRIINSVRDDAAGATVVFIGHGVLYISIKAIY